MYNQDNSENLDEFGIKMDIKMGLLTETQKKLGRLSLEVIEVISLFQVDRICGRPQRRKTYGPGVDIKISARIL